MSRLEAAEQAAADRTYVEPWLTRDEAISTIKELMEALEKCEGEFRALLSGHVDTATINNVRMDARSALSRAKSLMEQKP